MVLYTPNRNLPYVQPTDTVTSYPVTSQDLATKLDAVPAVYTGTQTATTITTAATVMARCTAAAQTRPVLAVVTGQLLLSSSGTDIDYYLKLNGAQPLLSRVGARTNYTTLTCTALFAVAANTAITAELFASIASGTCAIASNSQFTNVQIGTVPQ